MVSGGGGVTAPEPESIGRARKFMAQRDRLVRKRDKILVDAYVEAQREMATRIEREMEHRQDEYGKVVFDEEAARLLDIEQEIEKLSPRIADEIHEGMREQTRLAVEQAEMEMEVKRQQAGIGIAFGRMNKEAVEALASRVSERRNITGLLRGHAQEYKNRANKTLLSQQIQGKNPKEAARILQREMGGGGGTLSRWLTVARTEMLDANRIGLGAVYQRHGNILRGKERLATLDERTCMACVALDGQVYPLDAPEDGHQNCRCTWLPVLKRQSRRDRRREQKRLGLRGEKWFKAQPKAVQQKMMGMQKWTYWKRDVIEFDDLVVERSNYGWRPAKYEASLKDALSFYDRTPLGRLMSELKRVPYVGRAVPFLFSPADEVLMIAWKGRNFTKLLAGARSDLVESSARGFAESGLAQMTDQQRMMVEMVVKGKLRTATEHFLFGIYRQGMPRIVLPNQGPMRNVDKWMHSRLTSLSNRLQPRLQKLLLKDFEKRVVERAEAISREAAEKAAKEAAKEAVERGAQRALVKGAVEVVEDVGPLVMRRPLPLTPEALFDRLARYQPIARLSLGMPTDPMIRYPLIPYVIDEYTVWGSLADDLRMASTVTPGEGYLLSEGGVNQELIDKTYETIVEGRMDPLRAADQPNGGVFFTRNEMHGATRGTIYWTPNESAVRQTVDDLKLIFDAAYQSTSQLPVGWQQVGTYTRVIQDAGTSAYHNSLNLESAWQGLGFAEKFYQRSWIYYLTHGVKEVSLQTANIGSYTWAKNWMIQFTSGYTAMLVTMAQRNKVRAALAAGHFSEEELSRWLNQIVAREERGDPMRSHELAVLGQEVPWAEEDDDGILRRMHFGKMIMIGAGWSGKIKLAAPTETTRFGVPWPVPDLFMSRYPRLMGPHSIINLDVDIEQTLRAWIVSVIIEEARIGGFPIEFMGATAHLPGATVQFEELRQILRANGSQVENIVQSILIPAQFVPQTEAIAEVRAAVEDTLLKIRNRLTEDPGRVPLLDAIRQAFPRSEYEITEEILEAWLAQLEISLPRSITFRRPLDEPPPSGAPPVPSGGPRPPAPAPAGAPAATEPFRPLPAPPVLNPWARTLSETETRETLRALHRMIQDHTDLDAEDVHTYMVESDDIFQDILVNNQPITLLRQMEAEMAIGFSRPVATAIKRELQAFLVGYLSTSPFEWASIDLWSDNGVTLNAVANTLNRYGIPPSVITRAAVQEVFAASGLDMAETIRNLLLEGELISVARIQTIYEALKYQGGFVPESSRRLQSRAVPAAAPDYEYFELAWGLMPTAMRAQGQVRLEEELTWALTDNLSGDAVRRREQAESLAPRLAELTIEELINGLAPEPAMRRAFQRLEYTIGYPLPRFAANGVVIRVTGSSLFRPIPIPIDAEAVADLLQPVLGEHAQAVAARIAANPDRPLQIAQQEAERFILSQVDPVDFERIQQQVLSRTQLAIGGNQPIVDPALRRRARQIFGDIGIYQGAGPATRLMEAHFVRALATGLGPRAAIREAIATVLPTDTELADRAMAQYTQRPLSAPIPVLNMSLPENRRAIQNMLNVYVTAENRADLEIFWPDPTNLPVDEAIALANADYLPTEVLLSLLEDIRLYYGRPGLVSDQMAVDPVPHMQLLEPDFNQEVAHRIYLAYYGTRIPDQVSQEDIPSFLEGVWQDYRNNEIPRYPVDVDVRLRRALDVADFSELYNSFRYDLTEYGERPLREVVEAIFETGGWSPETTDHLIWLIESDPVLAQFGRPAPVQYQRFTYPERGTAPAYTEAQGVMLFEMFYDTAENLLLFSAGEGQEYIDEQLRAAFDHYYSGALPLLPDEVIQEAIRASQRAGYAQHQVEGLVRNYSGHELSFDEAVNEWLMEYHPDAMDEIANQLDNSRVIQIFREQEHQPPPLWQPVSGSNAAAVIEAMVTQTGAISDITFRNPRQRDQANRVLRGLLNRIGIGEFTVDRITTALRTTYSMVEVWQGDQRIVEVAEQMFYLARQTARGLTPGQAPATLAPVTPGQVRIIPPGPWQDLRHEIMEAFTEAVDEWGFERNGTRGSPDEFREWRNIINNALPETLNVYTTRPQFLDILLETFVQATDLDADATFFLNRVTTLPEWERFWLTEPALWLTEPALSWENVRLALGELVMADADEIAAAFPTPPPGVSEEVYLRRAVQDLMPEESPESRDLTAGEIANLAEWRAYWLAEPAPIPMVMPVWPEPPAQATWIWEGSADFWSANLPGEYTATLDIEGLDFQLRIYEPGEAADVGDWIYDNETHVASLADGIAWATEMVNIFLSARDLPAVAAAAFPQVNILYDRGVTVAGGDRRESQYEFWVRIGDVVVPGEYNWPNPGYDQATYTPGFHIYDPDIEDEDIVYWFDWAWEPNTIERDDVLSSIESILRRWASGELTDPEFPFPPATWPPPAPTMPVALPHRFPTRPSDPYLSIIPEQFREESVALRNMPQWSRIEQLDSNYAAARDAMRRYMETRLAGSNQLQALAKIHEDLEPGISQNSPDYQRRRLAELHNGFMEQLMGGARYGGTPDPNRTMEDIQRDLEQTGAVQRPLGPDPEEIRLLRSNINERLDAGVVPFQTDLQELSELTGQTMRETLEGFIRDRPGVIDVHGLRTYIMRRLAAGFHVSERDPYLLWISDTLDEDPADLLSQYLREIEDQPGPGTALNPPDPIMSDGNPGITLSWPEYQRRLEAVPEAQQLQRLWNAAETSEIEEALRRIFIDPYPEDDERWDLARASLRGATLRDVQALTRFTQETLRAAGITHVRLHRGEGAFTESLEEWVQDRFEGAGDGRFRLIGRGATSWSIFESVAEEFALYSDADYDVLFEAVVPIEQVAFMFPTFTDIADARDIEVTDLPYPTFGEVVVVGDIYAEVTIVNNETNEIVEPEALPLDRRAIELLTFLAENTSRGMADMPMADAMVRIRNWFEDNDRQFNTVFWAGMQQITTHASAAGTYSHVIKNAVPYVYRRAKTDLIWLTTVSKAVQIALLDKLSKEIEATTDDPWKLFRVMEGWRLLVNAGVEVREAFERVLQQNRMAPLIRRQVLDPIWQALEWERTTQHQPLQNGDVVMITTEAGIAGIARVAYDEVIDEVEGWRQTNLIYLQEPLRATVTRIDSLPDLRRVPEIRWIEMSGRQNVNFEEQARRAALADIKPGERVFLTKQADARAWIALYVPEHMVPEVEAYMSAFEIPIIGLTQRPIPATPRVGSNILIDDQNAHMSFLDDRDSYVVRLLNAFPDPDEANRVAEIYHMWKGGADTEMVQAIYRMEPPIVTVMPIGELPYPAQTTIDPRDNDLLKRMIRFTQEDLRRRGITHVRLFRGITPEQIEELEAAGLTPESVGEEVELVGRTMSSWSIYRAVAQQFAGYQMTAGADTVVMTTVVPIEKVAMVFPPFPLQAPEWSDELVEGEFALLGGFVASIHEWMPFTAGSIEMFNEFLGSEHWTEIVSELNEGIDEPLGQLVQAILLYIPESGSIGEAFDIVEQETLISTLPDLDKWREAFDLLASEWSRWAHGQGM